MPQFLGLSLAPALTREKVEACRSLADRAGGDVGEALHELADLAETWLGLPRVPQGPGEPHPGGFPVSVHRLTPPEAAALALDLPTPEELAEMGPLFDAIPAGRARALREACFYLLWVANELSLGRHPLFLDKLAR